MSFQIKPASENDLAQIIEAMREFAEFEKLEHDFSVAKEKLSDAIFGENAFVKVLVAFAENEIVAYALFFPVFKSFRGERSVYLEDLYVRPNRRGQGLGLKMLKKVAEYAAENGFVRMDWQALNWNEKAIKFYKNLGAQSNDENVDFRLIEDDFDKLSGRTNL